MSVLYYCPCFRSPADQVEQLPAVEEDEQLDLTDDRVKSALFPLERLYFCDDCHVHRCPRCVLEEVVTTYCPNCLYEVNNRTGFPDGHCPRNCFRCPVCQSTAQTVGNDSTGYHLQCVFCEYNTLALDLQLRKPTSIAKQIAQQRPDVKQDTFRLLAKTMEKRATQARESEMDRTLQRYRDAMKISPTTEPEETHTCKQVDATVDTPGLLEQKSMEKARMTALPLPVPLVSKLTKRCRACRSLLVRPDPRPGAITFRSRLYAYRVLPTFSLARTRSRETVLEMTNPMAVACEIGLSTARQTAEGYTVVLPCPQVRIGADQETWPTSSSSDDKDETREQDGVVRRGRNSVAVLIEMTPPSSSTSVSASTKSKDDIELAVFCRVKYTSQGEGNHAEDDDNDDNDDDDGEKERRYGCWVVLKLTKEEEEEEKD